MPVDGGQVSLVHIHLAHVQTGAGGEGGEEEERTPDQDHRVGDLDITISPRSSC